MKKLIYYLTIIVSFSFVSCTDYYQMQSNDKTNLKITIPNAELLNDIGNIDIRLYELKQDIYDEIYYKRIEFDFIEKDESIFEDVEPGSYYIKAYQLNNDDLFIIDTVIVEENKTTTKTLNLCECDLTVFVKIGSTSQYCGGARVDIYKSESDFQNNKIFMTTYTDSFDPIAKPLIINDLVVGDYVITATWYEASNQKYYGELHNCNLRRSEKTYSIPVLP